MNERQRDAVLAGLRLLQQRLDGGSGITVDIADIYTNNGRHKGLSSGEIDSLATNLNLDSLSPYTRLEIEHCIEAENRWGESFVETIQDPERTILTDVLDDFWTIYGRRHDGMADALHDAESHDTAIEIAGVLSICAFNSIPVVDNSPEGQLEQLKQDERSEHDHAPGGPGTA